MKNKQKREKKTRKMMWGELCGRVASGFFLLLVCH